MRLIISLICATLLSSVFLLIPTDEKITHLMCNTSTVTSYDSSRYGFPVKYWTVYMTYNDSLRRVLYKEPYEINMTEKVKCYISSLYSGLGYGYKPQPDNDALFSQKILTIVMVWILVFSAIYFGID